MTRAPAAIRQHAAAHLALCTPPPPLTTRAAAFRTWTARHSHDAVYALDVALGVTVV